MFLLKHCSSFQKMCIIKIIVRLSATKESKQIQIKKIIIIIKKKFNYHQLKLNYHHYHYHHQDH